MVRMWYGSSFVTFSTKIACVAGGIVGVRNNVLTAEPLQASGEAARRMGFSRLPLAMSGSAAKILFRAPTIPPATQATIKRMFFISR